MSRSRQLNTPQTRDAAKTSVRRLTRAAILGATGVATLIGIVVAQEHPGSSTTSKGSGAAGSKTSSGSGATTGGSSSSSTGNTGNTGNTGSTGSSGNTGTSAPSSSSSRPNVVSGGTSR